MDAGYSEVGVMMGQRAKVIYKGEEATELLAERVHGCKYVMQNIDGEKLCTKPIGLDCDGNPHDGYDKPPTLPSDEEK